jgi:hypothetical protein
MKTRIKALVLILAVVAIALAQSSSGYVVPQYLPATTTTILTCTSCSVVEIQLINSTSSSATAVIQDRQGTPIDIIPNGIAIPAKSDHVWEFTGRLAPGGIQWSASAANTIQGYIRWQ